MMLRKSLTETTLRDFYQEIKYHQANRRIYGTPFFLWRRIKYSRISTEETEGTCV